MLAVTIPVLLVLCVRMLMLVISRPSASTITVLVLCVLVATFNLYILARYLLAYMRARARDRMPSPAWHSAANASNQASDGGGEAVEV